MIDEPSGQSVLHVYDPHALIQAVGYLKFTEAQSSALVFYRGQSRLYNTMSPTLFRGCSTQAAQARRINEFNNYINTLRDGNDIFKKMSRATHEPLPQHYGLKTTWIDLVDNVWIALWFACHIAHVSGTIGEYLHFERRRPHRFEEPYAYIVLVATDMGKALGPGLYRGTTTEFVDLRVACPSVFLRPHSQHGVLFRIRGDHIRRPPDYARQIRGAIRINLSDALMWLGTGDMLGVHALFPPPYYDHGYAILLEADVHGSDRIGSIARVGA